MNDVPEDILMIELSASGNNNCFKKHLKLWLNEKVDTFNCDRTCTWIVKCKCSRCCLA